MFYGNQAVRVSAVMNMCILLHGERVQGPNNFEFCKHNVKDGVKKTREESQ